MNTKSLFRTFGAIAMSAMTLLACTKDEETSGQGGEPGTEPGTLTAPELTADRSSVEIDLDNPDAAAVTFEWTSAVDEGTAGVSYTLYVNLASRDIFTNPASVEVGSALSASLTNTQLNDMLVENFGIAPGEQASLKASVYAVPEDESAEAVISNEVTFSASASIQYPGSIILVGSATTYGWAPAEGLEIPETEAGSLIYKAEGVQIRPSGGAAFKFFFSRDENDWRIGQKGSDFTDIEIVKEGEHDFIPGNFGYGNGVYTVTVDLNKMELGFERTGDLPATELPDKLYLLGDALEWGWNWSENTLNKTSDKVYEIKNIKLAFGDNDDCGFKVFLKIDLWSPYYAMDDASTNGNIIIKEIAEGDGPQFYPGKLGYEDGYYDMEMNFNTMVMTLTPVSDPYEGYFSMNGSATPGGWDSRTMIPKIGEKEWEVTGVYLTLEDESASIKVYASPDGWYPYYGQMNAEGEEFGMMIEVLDDDDRETKGDPTFYPYRYGYTSGTYTINVNTETMKLTLTKEE